jgi:hypothetical protein
MQLTGRTDQPYENEGGPTVMKLIDFLHGSRCIVLHLRTKKIYIRYLNITELKKSPHLLRGLKITTLIEEKNTLLDLIMI